MGKVPDISFAGKTREQAEAMLQEMKSKGEIADYRLDKVGGVYRATMVPVKEKKEA
ncbi:MAG: SPOR domain-containing protein [Candidatus Schekmanbacteria bacterium]|nr:SPOR domain-containing protein [Candidatus Schekmanbacteria bacterium]